MSDLAETIVDALFQQAQAGDGAMSREKMIKVVQDILNPPIIELPIGTLTTCNAKDLPVYGEWTKIGGHDDLATWQRSA